MAEQQRQYSLTVLAVVQAALGALIAIVIFTIYAFAPTTLENIGLSLTTAILGVVGVVYFGTIHQFLARKHQALSTLILTLITATNIILLIITTGGLNSPYYSLWLLAIVAAGIFGTRETYAVMGVTLAYFVASIILGGGLNMDHARDYLIQFVITLAAGGLSIWVHSRTLRANVQKSALESLSGQLNEEQLKAQVLVSSIGEGVLVIDAERHIQIFNKAAQQLTGWDEESARGIEYNLVLQLHDLEDKELTEENNPFAEAWRTKAQVMRDNITTTTKSGRKITLSISISPMFDGSGNATGAIALFRDISHEKAVERQKDEFVSTASHEMRTPVAAIEGYISLAMNPNVATIDDRAMKYLTKAHETIQHLGELFRDLLSVTKAEEGNLNAKIGLVNLGELLQAAVDDMQFTAEKKKLTLIYQVSNVNAGKAIAPLYYVAANPERLREVVMNLIDNAIKFTAQGGITVTVEGNDKEVQVGVSDTGVGIAAEDMPHLFQKFYRIDNTATRTIGGTGLGLYLCRTVIELFNGRVWVTSQPGQGSTFHFMLPRLSAAEISQMQQQQATAQAQDLAHPAPGTPTPAGATVQPAPASEGPAEVQPAPAPVAAVAPAAPLQPISMPIPGEVVAPVPVATVAK